MLSPIIPKKRLPVKPFRFFIAFHLPDLKFLS